MASLLHADLPSEDEADDDYDPDAEEQKKTAKKAKALSGPSRCAPCDGLLRSRFDQHEYIQASVSLVLLLVCVVLVDAVVLMLLNTVAHCGVATAQARPHWFWTARKARRCFR
jgi:Flp pilus assembly protein TadB